mgnify:FL=1
MSMSSARATEPITGAFSPKAEISTGTYLYLLLVKRVMNEGLWHYQGEESQKSGRKKKQKEKPGIEGRKREQEEKPGRRGRKKRQEEKAGRKGRKKSQN